MQIEISRCLLLWSTRTPAGKASRIAGITSLNPSIPSASLLPVISYNCHPINTGVIRRPAINKSLTRIKRVNSRLMMIWEKGFFNGLGQGYKMLPILVIMVQGLYDRTQVFFIAQKIRMANIHK